MPPIIYGFSFGKHKYIPMKFCFFFIVRTKDLPLLWRSISSHNRAEESCSRGLWSLKNKGFVPVMTFFTSANAKFARDLFLLGHVLLGLYFPFAVGPEFMFFSSNDCLIYNSETQVLCYGLILQQGSQRISSKMVGCGLTSLIPDEYALISNLSFWRYLHWLVIYRIFTGWI